MRLPKPRSIVLAGLATALSLAAIGSALADRRVHQITVEVRFLTVDRDTFREFNGAIETRKPCRDDREVGLFYKPTETSAPQKVGEGETNGKGAFDIHLQNTATAGLYSAVVKKEIERDHDGDDVIKYICKPGSFPYARF